MSSIEPHRQSPTTPLHPTTFIRHNRQLRTLLLEAQVWFCAQDFGRLMGWPLNERTTRMLDADQRRVVVLVNHDGPGEVLMVSESGIYAMLVHRGHAENRELRRWVTHEVVPCVHERQPFSHDVPSLSQLQWPELSVCLLNWQAEPWIRLRDMPRLLPHAQMPAEPTKRRVGRPWWRAAWQVMRFT